MLKRSLGSDRCLRRGRRRWNVLALALAFVVSGCATASDPDDPATATPGDAAVARQALPVFDPGTRMSDIQSRLAGWPPGHRFSADGASMEGWEWSGPDGMRVEAGFSGGLAVSMRVSRTWGSGAPPVEGRKLPEGFTGRPREALEAAVGPGLLVDRTWALDRLGSGPVVFETYTWAIHDRGLDTGLFMTVTVRGGIVVAVSHRWSGE